MKTFEARLTELVERVAPASLRITYTTTSEGLLELLPSLKKSKHFSVSFQTRSFDEGASASSVRQAIEMTLDSLDNGPKDIDPVVPSWYALSRKQREVVEHILKRHVAEHKERAAAKNLARDPHARLEYDLADAFEAALACLEFEYENVAGTEWEPLHARGDAVRKPTDPVEMIDKADEAAAAAKRRKKVSANLKDLRVKNRSKAKVAGIAHKPR